MSNIENSKYSPSDHPNVTYVVYMSFVELNLHIKAWYKKSFMNSKYNLRSL